MKWTVLIGLSMAAALFLCVLLLILQQRKSTLIANRFSEALQAENNGDAERAIQLYQEALKNEKGKSVGDKLLVSTIKRRLKTLQISNEFEERFHRKEIIG